jgi:hypothetical protein
MLNRKNKRKGQSTLEYIVLVTGVIVVLIIFLGPTGVFRSSYNKTLSSGTNGMEDMAGRLATSRPAYCATP